MPAGEACLVLPDANLAPVPEPLPVLADVAIDVPGRDTYTYRVPDLLIGPLTAGDCVSVPFGPRTLRGFVLTVGPRMPPEGIRLRDIAELRPGVRVPAPLLRLIQWGARYYRCSIGEFLAGAVPAPVREGMKPDRVVYVEKAASCPATLTARQAAVLAALPDGAMTLIEACRLTNAQRGMFERLAALGAVNVRHHQEILERRLDARDERHPLTQEQEAAVAAVVAATGAEKIKPFLLYGVTGSGKTLVYLELAERALAAGKQVLLLLPEIALTPQLAARVRRRIARVAVWHSGFTDGERAEQWRRIHAGEVDLVLGTRSALFAPLPALGLIIVDEEHETSYKQESVPRYHARDLAVVYAGQLGIPVVLGSATPSLESIHNGRTGRYQVLQMRKRPLGGSLPSAILVDMREESRRQRRSATVSGELLDRLRQVRAAGEQAIVLLNRRGWSPVVSCVACGSVLMCANCDISLTYHRGPGKVRCHYCAAEAPMPRRCPACGDGELSTFGLGTEQLAANLSAEIADLRVLRVDADTVSRRQGHATLFEAFAKGAADCLVGTQMVAKGLDFPRVTLVGIVCADRGLSVPDFRAAERTYQLIAQVAGRAGRGEKPGTVVVQAFDTEALALRCAIEHRPKTFFDEQMELRRSYGYPPFTGLVRIQWSGESLANVQLVASAHGARINAVAEACAVLGPSAAGLAFLKGMHRWHVLIKAPSRGAAQAFLDRLAAAGGLEPEKGVRVAIDVDPVAIS
jgi:primosomal protein N' (replication factor Y)